MGDWRSYVDPKRARSSVLRSSGRSIRPAINVQGL
jgi:hypothetical protein